MEVSAFKTQSERRKDQTLDSDHQHETRTFHNHSMNAAMESDATKADTVNRDIAHPVSQTASRRILG